MDLYTCQREAKKIGFDTAVFEIEAPSGVLKCKWIDAYFGLFKIDKPGMDKGFITVQQMVEMLPELTCRNLHVP